MGHHRLGQRSVPLLAELVPPKKVPEQEQEQQWEAAVR